MPRGRVFRVNVDNKGYGFIQPEDGQGEVFYHNSNVRGGAQWLQVGCIVDYNLTTNTHPGHEGKKHATDVRQVSGRADGSCSPASKMQCDRWLGGRCDSGDQCQFAHPRKPCVDFVWNGSCDKGAYCADRHAHRSPPRGPRTHEGSQSGGREINDWDVHYFWDDRYIRLTRGDDVSTILTDLSKRVADLVTDEGCRWLWRNAKAYKRYYNHDGDVPAKYMVPPHKLRHLSVDGWNAIDPGPTPVADRMKLDMIDLAERCQRFSQCPGSGGVDPNRTVVVVITGDLDFASALQSLLQDGKISRLVLVYREPVNMALVGIVEHAIRWDTLYGVAWEEDCDTDYTKIILQEIPWDMPDDAVLEFLKDVGIPIRHVRNTKTSMKVTMATEEQAAGARALSGTHFCIQIQYDTHPDSEEDGGTAVDGGSRRRRRRRRGRRARSLLKTGTSDTQPPADRPMGTPIRPARGPRGPRICARSPSENRFPPSHRPPPFLFPPAPGRPLL
eukprot:TRINITY_DN1846_c0_g2_i5.p1 TRINITY_DN1846_c0_g2~~TRINITY_DN1846_c0_g2_i5.p1  ORF type:complete len:528 (+),score=41.93 TRINITY_DN1846_c0_g2_i5:87-1586(+)